MPALIDPPSPFAPLSEWRRYLVELEKAPNAPEFREAIREAREHIEAAR